MTDAATRSGPVDAGRLLERQLWILAGQAAVIVIVFIGSESTGARPPKIVMGLIMTCVVPMLAFLPTGVVGRIIVTAPLSAYVGWWLASYLWTYNVYGWWTDTQRYLPIVFAAAVVAGVLPREAFASAVITACQLVVGYTLMSIALHPSVATVNPDGVPGWRGAFPHKNAMGVFMVFAILVMTFRGRPSWSHRLTAFVAFALLIVSQSTTALAGGLAVMIGAVFLRRFQSGSAERRALLLVGGLLASVTGALVASSIVPTLLGLRGKDTTLTSRTDVWRGVWGAIKQRPWAGYGIGGVWSDPSVDPGRSINRGLGFTVFHAHNGFLEILLLLGIVGLALFAWLVVSTFRSAVGSLRAEPDLAIFVVCLLILVATVSIAEVATRGVWLALLAAYHTLLARPRDEQADSPRHPVI